MLRYLDTVIAFAVVMLGVSLLITVVTQMISALFGLRGTNLKWGLQTLIETIEPATKLKPAEPKALSNAEKLVNQILRHPLISDSAFSGITSRFPFLGRWKLASAIRKQELIVVLQNLYDLTKDPQTTDEELRKLEVPIQQVLTAVSASPISNISGMVADIQRLAGDAAAVEKKAVELVKSVRNTSQEFALWFDASMDRVSQRFAMQMRWWTVAVALITAFVLHLDALKLLTQFWADPGDRSALVSAADSMVKQADSILVTGNPSTPAVYAKAVSDLKSGPLAEVVKSLGEPPPGVLSSREDVVNWLRTQLAGSPQREEVIRHYQSLVDAGLQANLSALSDKFKKTRDTLEQAEFELVPSPYPSWREYMRGYLPSRHFWGTLAAAALLSLGAPFWFNALKSLTNLRPVVAQKQEKEEKEAKAQKATA
jgi:hypothetical protein